MAEMHAWVDESGSDRTLDPDTYILAAALCPHDAMDEVRGLMSSLRIKGTPKLHWRDETKPARRMTIVETVASCEALEHLIVVRAGTDTESRRRPRAATMARLLYELDQHQVTRAVLESRGPSDDRHDMRVVQTLRDQQQAISPALKVGHQPGRLDPGLWVADALCGVVSSSRTGDARYLEVLGDRLTMVSIDSHGHTLA